MDSLKNCLLLKDTLDTFKPIDPTTEKRIMDKFRLDWNYHSNNLEGNSLTYGETKALLLHGITANGKPLKDHFEVEGHNDALNWVLDIVKGDYEITQKFIRELHSLILKEPYYVKAQSPDGKETRKLISVGQYKTTPNHVKTITGEMFYFATPEETPSKMNDLVDWYTGEILKKDINPIVLASTFHYKYIRIHPFDDGNGRTARILMNFILMKFGYPPVIIKTDDKESYFRSLRQADTGMINEFIDYISQNLEKSLNIMISGAKGESIEEEDDILKEIKLLEQKFKHTGDDIKITKSIEVISTIFNDSITKAWDKFNKYNNTFNSFYVTNSSSLYINNGGLVCTPEEQIDRFKKKINTYKDINQIHFTYGFRNMNKQGLENIIYGSNIYFKFGLSGYKVSNTNNKITFEKKYPQQLSEEEITSLIQSEVKQHKLFIENKMNGK